MAGRDDDNLGVGFLFAVFIVAFLVSLTLMTHSPERFETKYDFPRTDKDYRYGPLPSGYYGDVPVYFWRNGDNAYAPEWRKAFGGGLYVHDSNTYRLDSRKLPKTKNGELY
jgi:hypothetical protein